MPDPSCPSCGGELPAGSRFCPHCGTRLSQGAGDTAVIEPPPDETGPVPVKRESVQPHLFGVTPPVALLVLAVAALAVGVLLLVVGRLVLGAVVLVGGALLLVAFARIARPKPGGDGRGSATAADGARDRLASAYAAFSARSRARRRAAAVRAELLRLGDRRRELLLALGRAVYEHDASATESVRARLAELDRTAVEKEAEMQTIVAEARAEVERAQLEVQHTEMVEVPGSPGIGDPAPGEGQPPGPARIPEPYPPPDEGDLPGPARVPEPYPPPDEGDPPDPARVPEPGPGAR